MSLRANGTVKKANETESRSDNAENGVKPTGLILRIDLDKHCPNIKFCGRPTYDRAKKKILNDPQPVESIRFGNETVTLPAAEFQKAKRLFFHTEAGRIIRAFPHLYKRVK